MKTNLEDLMPVNISDESLLDLVSFVRTLSLTLEAVFFDKLLLNSTELRSKIETFTGTSADDNPF